MNNKKDIITCTQELLDKCVEAKVIEDNNPEKLVSTSFIYRTEGTGDNKKTIIGLNVQLYGHILVIVPNIYQLEEFYTYSTKEKNHRADIVKDLTSKGFSDISIAKFLRCSVASIEKVYKSLEGDKK